MLTRLFFIKNNNDNVPVEEQTQQVYKLPVDLMFS